jgi:hypothetical protein
MRVSTLIHYLFGSRRAIIEVANCRGAVWLGMLFVISAALAREYDGKDLLHEPWHLALPLAVSLLTSFLLFVLLETAFPNRHQQAIQAGRFVVKYRALLGLYWMTAPLAWLYAVPVERFLGVADAVRANLLFLGLVALWRVALMTRVVSIIYSRQTLSAFAVVMLLADSVALAVFWLTPVPLLSVMGGIRLSESESVMQGTVFLVRLLATLSWPIWLVGALAAGAIRRGSITGWSDVDLSESGSDPVSSGLWGLSALSVIVWAGILPFTQVEQINRWRAERDLRDGRIEDALAFMSQLDRSDFPPHWDPPPRIGYGEEPPSLVDILLHLQHAPAPAWVHDIYREKLALQSRADLSYFYGHAIRLDEMDDNQLARYVKLLESLPEGPAMARYHQSEIEQHLRPQDDERGPELVSDQRQALFRAILTLLPDHQADAGREPWPRETR